MHIIRIFRGQFGRDIICKQFGNWWSSQVGRRAGGNSLDKTTGGRGCNWSLNGLGARDVGLRGDGEREASSDWPYVMSRPPQRPPHT